MSEPKTFTCHRCGATQPDWLIFGTRRRYYCLGHIPWYVRLSMHLRGVV